MKRIFFIVGEFLALLFVLACVPLLLIAAMFSPELVATFLDGWAGEE